MMSNDKKILCVDGDASVRRALWQELRLAGFDVLLADSGLEAIELLRKNEVAVVVSDERMPGMGGIELLELALHLCPRTTRVALTQSRRASAAGAPAVDHAEIFRFLPKTWEPGELLQVVRDAAKSGAARDAQKRP
jgi:DNA-binding NtrC family response regulator